MPRPILYYSTNLKAPRVSFKEALLKGLAPDGGLYMPESLPEMDNATLNALTGKKYYEIAHTVLELFLTTDIPGDELLAMAMDAYDYDVPLEPVYERKFLLRLDRGPTASFKDFAARMMGRLMQYFLHLENRDMLILTATSGDTGSAIANAFYGLENIRVVVLFPEKEVTERQRKQMTTLGKNVHIIGIEGKFDDCQALVKKAFSDPQLDRLNLSSANSINIGRLIPQSVYFFFAWSMLKNRENEPVIFSVPSGNFGDLMGGLIAFHMGLPVKKFVVSTNENDEVPVYFQTGKYKTIIPSRDCISSAMNVGHPSNMARIIALYGGVMDEHGVIIKEPDVARLKKAMHSISINDLHTKAILKSVYERHHVLLEPHGAVGWAGLQEYFRSSPEDAVSSQLAVCLETAHPAKFPAEINELLGFDPELPDSMKGLDQKKESWETMKSDYNLLKIYLLDKFSR
ncbi:MAG: threonine synthase [Bacteroidales bacterium]|nr:threonine synthase [Bacteroidales bacterium]